MKGIALPLGGRVVAKDPTQRPFPGTPVVVGGPLPVAAGAAGPRQLGHRVCQVGRACRGADGRAGASRSPMERRGPSSAHCAWRWWAGLCCEPPTRAGHAGSATASVSQWWCTVTAADCIGRGRLEMEAGRCPGRVRHRTRPVFRMVAFLLEVDSQHPVDLQLGGPAHHHGTAATALS